jgi:hypothetical protein
VVKVFNNVTFWHLSRWLVRPGRPTAAPCRSPGTTRPPRPRWLGSWTRSGTTASTPVRSALVAAASRSGPARSWHRWGGCATSGDPGRRPATLPRA